MTEQHDFEPVRQRREALYHVMLDLEVAIAAPVGDTEMWLERVAAVAAQVREVIDEHIAETEAPGGFLQQVVSESPRLVNKANRLEREHADLQHEAGHLVTVLSSYESADLAEATSEVRRQANELLGDLTRHRQRGSDLIYEAYEVDIGGGC